MKKKRIWLTAFIITLMFTACESTYVLTPFGSFTFGGKNSKPRPEYTNID